MAKNELNDKIEELNWDFDGKKMIKDLDFDSFSESLDFLNEVASIVEDIGVHPKVHISTDGIKLTLPASGQINKDHVNLAEGIDDLE
jgi:pterin-4a-carbinolamine dehydratase